MHLTQPRIAPLTDDALTPAQRDALAPLSAPGRPALNIFRTLAHAPEALTAFLAWGGYVLSKKNALAPREREIVILRTGYLCGSGYEWTQHVEIGKRAGLTDADIEALKSDDANWAPADAALITACDELHERQFVSDATWAALKAHFTDKQCMDVVFTAGQYTQVSMMLNSFGVQLDAGQSLDPDLDQR
ncbi:MAG: carboxymuconolactone decarboxylase family protein [Proteobacteria bacterium]|nr:carboxymuconolactone decarboxylase family protein [Pseudomonadota bacterium]